MKALSVIRDDVLAMHAYAVAHAQGLIKLDAMENPYALPAELQAELGQRLGAAAVNRYPGPNVEALKTALATYVDMPLGYELVLGNGSDELISMLAMACQKPGASVVAPQPGFVMYAMSAQLQGLNFVPVPLTADFELDQSAMLAAIAEHQPALVYLAYPNNPTANAWDEDVMQAIIDQAPGLVVIDEAYQPFASKTWLDRIKNNPERNANVLLMRTLSKFGLAGARIGYLLGPQALVAQINKVRPPYNISVLNAECALFALEHQAVFAQQAQEIKAERERLIHEMAKLPGVKVFPSQANMILVRVPNAQKTFDALKAQGILIKNVSTMHSLLQQCLRITVGTPQENTSFLTAFQTSL